MSYCRMSDDSDIYAYRTGDVYTIRVASGREAQWGKFEPVGLPLDGKVFTEYSLEMFETRLVDLRDMGYRVPDHTFDRIRRELNEQGPFYDVTNYIGDDGETHWSDDPMP